MAHINKVMKSINSEDGNRGLDIFLRPDGTYGFEEFRRDVEDVSDWFPVEFYGDQIFTIEDDAFSAAKKAIGWLVST